MLKALIVDVDGTLADTEELRRRLWLRAPCAARLERAS